MKGHGEKLSRNQEKAIAALISHISIPAVAGSIGIGEVNKVEMFTFAAIVPRFGGAHNQEEFD